MNENEQDRSELRPQRSGLRDAGRPGGRTDGDVARRRLKIIGREPLETAIDIAVSRALHRHLADLDRGRREAIRDTSRTELLELLRQNGRKVRATSKSQFMDELEKSRNEILASRDAATTEVEELRKQLEVYHNMQAADDQVRRAHAGEMIANANAELGTELARLFERFERGEIDAVGLQEQIRAFTSRMTRQGWDESFEERSKEYESQVDTLERRVAKLNLSLEESERALLELSKAKNIDSGVASVYRTVQGLSQNEDQWKVKEALLVKVFEANQVLQGRAAGA